jgi:hypothetical protein
VTLLSEGEELQGIAVRLESLMNVNDRNVEPSY